MHSTLEIIGLIAESVYADAEPNLVAVFLVNLQSCRMQHDSVGLYGDHVELLASLIEYFVKVGVY